VTIRESKTDPAARGSVGGSTTRRPRRLPGPPVLAGWEYLDAPAAPPRPLLFTGSTAGNIGAGEAGRYSAGPAGPEREGRDGRRDRQAIGDIVEAAVRGTPPPRPGRP